MSISGNRSKASCSVIICISRPKLRAMVASRLTSIMRSGEVAKRRLPTFRQSVTSPVSAVIRS
jgi:hypothetical protein